MHGLLAKINENRYQRVSLRSKTNKTNISECLRPREALFKGVKYLMHVINEKIVFRTRDANSAVNIRKLTRSWIETQTRPVFSQARSFTCFGENGKKEDDRC